MPKEPKTINLTISGVPVELRDELTKWAAEEDRDRSSQIVKLLKDAKRERDAAKRQQLAHAA